MMRPPPPVVDATRSTRRYSPSQLCIRPPERCRTYRRGGGLAQRRICAASSAGSVDRSPHSHCSTPSRQGGGRPNRRWVAVRKSSSGILRASGWKSQPSKEEVALPMGARAVRRSGSPNGGKGCEKKWLSQWGPKRIDKVRRGQIKKEGTKARPLRIGAGKASPQKNEQRTRRGQGKYEEHKAQNRNEAATKHSITPARQPQVRETGFLEAGPLARARGSSEGSAASPSSLWARTSSAGTQVQRAGHRPLQRDGQAHPVYLRGRERRRGAHEMEREANSSLTYVLRKVHWLPMEAADDGVAGELVE
eukprot:SM000099S25233  [mRNA]  locus=s99:323720:325340:+ [translate_table: standard]